MTEWSLEDWEKHFEVAPAASTTSAPPLSTGNGTRAHGPERQRVDPLSALEPVVATCTFVQHCRDHQPEIPEPWWHAMLSNLARCEGGRAAAHEFSKNHPNYSSQDTDKKFDHARTGSKPITCRRIQELGFDGCPPDGHGVASPVALGWPHDPEPAAAPAVEPVVEDETTPGDAPSWTVGAGAFLRQTFPPIETYIDPLLSSDGGGFIGGEEKLGKSFYALEEGLCLGPQFLDEQVVQLLGSTAWG
jgi:hypothetical protein